MEGRSEKMEKTACTGDNKLQEKRKTAPPKSPHKAMAAIPGKANLRARSPGQMNHFPFKSAYCFCSSP